jgi:hypothetical protein
VSPPWPCDTPVEDRRWRRGRPSHAITRNHSTPSPLACDSGRRLPSEAHTLSLYVAPPRMPAQALAPGSSAPQQGPPAPPAGRPRDPRRHPAARRTCPPPEPAPAKRLTACKPLAALPPTSLHTAPRRSARPTLLRRLTIDPPRRVEPVIQLTAGRRRPVPVRLCAASSRLHQLTGTPTQGAPAVHHARHKPRKDTPCLTG